MQYVIIIIVVAVLVYVVKSYSRYHSGNPYHAPKADYEHPFQKNRSGDIYQEVLQSEFGLIMALTAKVVKADGKICELEQELIDNTLDELSGYFSNKTKAREILEQILQEEEKEHDNIEQIASEFVNYTKTDPNKRIKIIEYLINLSFIDKVLSEYEEETIRKIAFYFHIPAGEFEQILKQFKTYYSSYSVPEKNPYEVLDVSKEITFSELKRKYRNLVKEHHPDVIKGKGGDEEFVQIATAKLQEINEAYEQIKKEKGFR